MNKDQQEKVNRILIKRKRVQRVNENRCFPEVWRKPLNEVTFLALVAHYFPIHISLKKLLQRLCPEDLKKSLLLSTHYLYRFKYIPPDYYSDAERLIVYCNHYIDSNEIFYLENCIKQGGKFTNSSLIHLLTGVLELDKYLKDLKDIHSLQRSKFIFKALEKDMGKESKVILAFIHYLGSEFNESSEILSAA